MLRPTLSVLLLAGVASAACSINDHAVRVNAACCVLEGGEIDPTGHSCGTDGGYEWCDGLQKCVREWETPCPERKRQLQTAAPCILPDTCPNKKCADAFRDMFRSCRKELHEFSLVSYEAFDALDWDCNQAYPASPTQKVPTWRLGGEGQSCDEVCKAHAQTCTEELWPATKEHLQTIAKRFDLECPNLEESTWAGGPTRSMQPMTGEWLCYVAAPEKKWTPNGDVEALCHGCDPYDKLKYTSGSASGDRSGSPGHRCGISEKVSQLGVPVIQISIATPPGKIHTVCT
jgi:hypothetical protein